MPAVLCNANGEYVDHGSATSIDDVFAGTIMCWVRLQTLSANPKFFAAKGSMYSYQFTNSHGVIFGISRATTSQLILVTNANLPVAPAAGVWYFVAVSYDCNGADTDQKLYVGNEAINATVVPAGTYTIQRAGSGAITSNAAEILTAGNLSAAAASSHLEGDLSFLALWRDRLLTPGQIIEQQRDPRPTGSAVLHVRYGENGAGLQIDRSGFGNHGTPVGATPVRDEPMHLRRKQRLRPVGAAAAFVGDDDGLIYAPRSYW